ncbi:MAG TPA: tRNA (guanine-N1)-methyltransferase [Flavobacterium sp.]|jgi:ABC-type multidrug transport system fused ATPase/permease subunit|nr:tRNA (guanine-N1)-methyltransferase [Flavobacterium sp.]HQV34765.1 tRNA (guanine-N1)-methyltransferase [Flavobacterium sp.]HRZ32623.1 tRNA (guanine-N1)-methyltransferase [Flavobacterium sp.]HRZ75329.1 tRNA (guanine-N1)-methyltransferase [Flavobacterium sp.]
MKNYFYFFLLLLTNVALSQEPNPESNSASINGTLANQFDYVIQKSNNFQEYKVVKRDYLMLLKKNSLDSVGRFKNELVSLKSQFSNHASIVAQLNDTLKATNEELKTLKTAQDNVSLFGSPISKTNYNIVMWGIVIVLFLILIVFLFQLKSAKSIAHEVKNNVEKIEEEFEDYKHKALEKEQKLGRQLQDEINKHKSSK